MKSFLAFLIVIFSIASLFFLYKGFDKSTNYQNDPEKSWNNINAYVGGDAYNYIINSNMATGYFVLGGAFCLSAIGCGILITVKESNINQTKQGQ